MPSYKMLIAYDGTDYFGWQQQPDQPTVAGVLEERFRRVFKQDISIVGASRTDAGVHALGQIAKFSLEAYIEPEKLIFAWNNVLPRDILVRKLCLEAEGFHPQRNVKEKTYHYHFFKQRPLPFIARYGYYNGQFDQQKLSEGLAIFIGTHDFRSFSTGYEMESTIRTIQDITLIHFKRYGVYRIVVKGPGFLRYMIRRIVGACLDVASYQNKSVDLLKFALEEKDPHQHLHVAPPHGLMLHSIEYER